MDLTEHKIESTQLVDGKLLKVFRDRVRLPDGGESEREWIDHPGAAAVVPLLQNGDVVLVRQFRYPVGHDFIEIPAGKIDVPGESPVEVAHRELEEESGYRAGSLTKLGAFHMAIGYSNEVIYLFLAEDLEAASSETEDDEFVEPFRLPFAEAVAMARRGEILDSKSAVALLRAGAVVDGRAG